MSSRDRITPVDGAGAGATARFIADEILPRFNNAALAPLEDGSFVDVDGQRLVLTADTHAVDPPIFPGGDVGRLSVAGTVNDLVASGAAPLYLTLGLTMSEGLPLAIVRTVLDSAASTAREAGVSIVAGDTKVVDRGLGGLLLHVTGLGRPVVTGREFGLGAAQPGDVVIVTGTIGDHEIAVLSQREGLGFEQRVASDCAPLHDLILPLLPLFDGIKGLRDPTRGGLLEVLCDLAERTGVEVRVDRDRVPVDPHVSAACEMLGLDPLHMVNEGKMVLVVSPDQADAVVGQLRAHSLGRESACVAVLGEPGSRPRVLVTTAGRARVVPRPEGSPLPRLC